MIFFAVGKLPNEQIITHSCIVNTFAFSSVGFLNKTTITPNYLNL